MHKIFRKALDEATGKSQFVIVVFIDIREFSAFSQRCESPDTAMFIKRVYMKIIDSYFENFASFYKSTGDGLLLTIPFNENNLKEMCQKTIASCIACHSEFGNICNNDPMITFEVPDKIGIGVARGIACCLISGETIIDYSGRLLNLASRLTDLARPSGIIIDGKFGINLLSGEQQGYFQEDNVYLDGIAEDEPIQICFTKEFTTIPPRNKRPIAEKRWRHKKETKPFRELLKLGGTFLYELESEPTSAEDIKVRVEYPKVIKGRIHRGYLRVHDFDDFTYRMEAGKPVVSVNFAELCRRLAQRGVRKNMSLEICIDYVEK